MPRKPKLEKKSITVAVNGQVISVTLSPPKGARKTWYAYWAGLIASRSTGQREFKEAVAAAESMLRNGGKMAKLEDTILSDEEFEEIQRRHFGRKTEPKAMARAEKSLQGCLEAIDAFKQISGLERIAAATPDDCANFQRRALTLPKSWRLKYPKARKGEGVERLSPSTIYKWSQTLQAAFQRANVNAGRKCVRGVVEEGKLLAANPWSQFTWVERREKPKRHFTDDELLSILDYFHEKWPEVEAGSAAAKLCLWTRITELANIRWNDLRIVDAEYHFFIEGKHGITKWARIPSSLYEELASMRTESPFVLAAYNKQLRSHHLQAGRVRASQRVGGEYSPKSFADWFQERVISWAENTSKPHAYPHVFRKTALQRARQGEDIIRLLADDAHVGASVMLAHYVDEGDDEFRHASNRMYWRLVKGLGEEIALRYGHREQIPERDFEAQLKQAVESRDWCQVAMLSAKLARG